MTRVTGIAFFLVLAGACSPDSGTEPQAPPGAEPAAPTPAAGDEHSSRNSLDWAGTYSGVTPCADCPGILTTITLRSDGTFERKLVYLERSVEPHADSGQFAWNDAGGSVTLQQAGGDGQQYKVGENTLIHLDRGGKPITGDLAARYVLHKHVHDPAIEGMKWTLTELRGKPVGDAAGGRGAFLQLDAGQSVAGGNASCNSFSGPYAIKSGNRISFDENLATTMMACADMSTEAAFLEVLRNVDNYAVADGVLSLNRARMAPLARFRVTDEP